MKLYTGSINIQYKYQRKLKSYYYSIPCTCESKSRKGRSSSRTDKSSLPLCLLLSLVSLMYRELKEIIVSIYHIVHSVQCRYNYHRTTDKQQDP